MGNRTVDININYIISTAQLNAAADASKKAQVATDNLRKSVDQTTQSEQKLGAQGAAATKQYESTIAGLTLKMQQLKAQIELTNKADTQRLNGLISQYKSAKKEVDDFNKKLNESNSATKSATTNTKSLVGQVGGLVTAVKTFIAAGFVREIVDTAIEMAKLSGTVEGVGRAFKNQIPNSLDLLDKLRNATHGTVTDLELMQRALKAQNFGINVQRLPELLEFAAVRAQQTGESIDYMVQSIVDGLGRKSILKLDNLGISASRLKEQFHGASLASLSVAQVTDGVADIVKEELEKMGGYVETGATKVDKLTASWQQLKVTVSQKIETSGFVGFLNNVVGYFDAAIKGSKQLEQEELRLYAAKQASSLLESKAFKDLGEDQQKKMDFIQQEINSRVQLIGRQNDMANALRKERETISGDVSKIDRVDQINKQIAAYEKQKFVYASTILALKDYLKEYSKVIEEEGEELGLIGRLRKDIEELQKDQADAKTPEEIGRINSKLQVTEAILKELIELGTKFRTGLESKVYDIKNTTLPNIKLDTSKLIDTKGLEEDYKRLGDNLAKKFNEGFEIGVPSHDPTVGETIRKEFEKAQDQLAQGGIDIVADQLIATENAEIQSMQVRLKNLHNFYDQQILLAGDNENAKKQLRQREQAETIKQEKILAEKQKKARLFSIIVDTAASIAKAWVNPGYPGAIPLSVLLAAQGASQYNIVSRAPTGFAKGVLNLKGAGTETSDSIPANLSKGESVMTAKETRRSFGLLEAIKENKIDDRILNKLHLTNNGVNVIAWDNKPVVEAIKNNRSPDLVKQGRQIYEVYRDKDNNKKFIRSKSI